MKLDKFRVYAGRRRHHRDDGRIQRPDGEGAGEGREGEGRPADLVQARRDAGLHAGRLQRRRLPRRGPRQGRLPAVAVRLRPGRRPLPPHPRNQRPAHQPRAAGRELADSRRRPARCRTPAASGSTRATSTTRRSSAGSKPTRRSTRRPSPLPVSVEVFPPSAVLDGKGEKQRIVVRAKYSDGTDRDVTRLALFLSNNDTSAKIDGGRRCDRRRPRRGVRHGPLRHLHRRRAVHRAAEGLCSSPGRTRPRTTTSTRSSTPSSRSSASRRRHLHRRGRSSAASTSTSSACCRRPRSTPGSWSRRCRTSASCSSTSCSTARSSPSCGC